MNSLQAIFHDPVAAIAIGIMLFVIMWPAISRAGWLPRCVLSIAPIAWLSYASYEMYMVQIWEPRVHAPIRLDLVLLFPVLCALSVLSLMMWAWLLWRLRRTK